METEKGHCFCCRNDRVISELNNKKLSKIFLALFSSDVLNVNELNNGLSKLELCPVCYYKLSHLKSISKKLDVGKVQDQENVCFMCGHPENVYKFIKWDHIKKISLDFKTVNEECMVCSECLYFLHERNTIKDMFFLKYPKLRAGQNLKRRLETSTPTTERRSSKRKRTDASIIEILSDEEDVKSINDLILAKKFKCLKHDPFVSKNDAVKKDKKFFNQIPYVRLPVSPLIHKNPNTAGEEMEEKVQISRKPFFKIKFKKLANQSIFSLEPPTDLPTQLEKPDLRKTLVINISRLGDTSNSTNKLNRKLVSEKIKDSESEDIVSNEEDETQEIEENKANIINSEESNEQNKEEDRSDSEEDEQPEREESEEELNKNEECKLQDPEQEIGNTDNAIVNQESDDAIKEKEIEQDKVKETSSLLKKEDLVISKKKYKARPLSKQEERELLIDLNNINLNDQDYTEETEESNSTKEKPTPENQEFNSEEDGKYECNIVIEDNDGDSDSSEKCDTNSEEDNNEDDKVVEEEIGKQMENGKDLTQTRDEWEEIDEVDNNISSLITGLLNEGDVQKEEAVAAAPLELISGDDSKKKQLEDSVDLNMSSSSSCSLEKKKKKVTFSDEVL